MKEEIRIQTRITNEYVLEYTFLIFHAVHYTNTQQNPLAGK